VKHFSPKETQNEVASTPLATNTERSKINFNDFAFDYQKYKLYIILFIFFFLCTPFGVLLWLGKTCLLKICCKRLFKRSYKGKNGDDTTNSGSVLSGECGCIIRVRKENNHRLPIEIPCDSSPPNQANKQIGFFFNRTKRVSVSSGNVQALQLISRDLAVHKFKSAACLLISLKEKSIAVDVIGKLESDEDEDDELDQYGEFSENSLNDLTWSVAQIENGFTI
jgi:hypothetical protein